MSFTGSFEADKVVGHYTLASGAVRVASAQGRFRRNMPDPIRWSYSRGSLLIALIRAATLAARWSATPEGAW